MSNVTKWLSGANASNTSSMLSFVKDSTLEYLLICRKSVTNRNHLRFGTTLIGKINYESQIEKYLQRNNQDTSWSITFASRLLKVIFLHRKTLWFSVKLERHTMINPIKNGFD